MISLSKYFLTLVFMFAAVVCAAAQNNPAGLEVRKLERAWLDAYEQNDAKAMNEIVADDFTITFPDGSRQTKSQIIALIKNPKKSPGVSVRFYTEETEARIYDSTVILTGKVITEIRRDGKTASKEQSRYTDTYVRQNGRWQVVASHLSNVSGIQN